MTPNEITGIVSNIFGVDVDDIRQKKHLDRADRVALARFAAISLCRKKTELTLSALARFFNLKTHSAMINAIETCSNMSDTNPTYSTLFKIAERNVNSSEFDRLLLSGFYPFVYSLSTTFDE